jgi:hypothetical protein
MTRLDKYCYNGCRLYTIQSQFSMNYANHKYDYQAALKQVAESSQGEPNGGKRKSSYLSVAPTQSVPDKYVMKSQSWICTRTFLLPLKKLTLWRGGLFMRSNSHCCHVSQKIFWLCQGLLSPARKPSPRQAGSLPHYARAWATILFKPTCA